MENPLDKLLKAIEERDRGDASGSSELLVSSSGSPVE